MSLPNKTTSDVQLFKWCNKHVDGFVDVINRKEIFYYTNMKPGQSLIINLDPDYKRSGTHWVALRVSSESPYLVFYKDSFGAPPPEDVIKAAKQMNRILIYGNNINQKLKETNCGKRAAE